MEIILLLVLTLLNGILSMSETAVVSSRKARLRSLADARRPGASVALALAEEPTNFLATIQVGITAIGITSGAFGEAALTQKLSGWLAQVPWAAGLADTLAFAIVITGITLLSLILGELVPKRLALVNPEAVATRIARPMQWLSRIVSPLVRALTAVTEGLLNLLGAKPDEGPPVTREEIGVLMDQGAEAGVFEAHQQHLVKRVFRLDDLVVGAVMTPRSEIVALDIDAPRDETVRRIVDSGHSRFPVTRGGLDAVVGIVLAKTLLEDSLQGRPVDLAKAGKPLFVPETLTAMDLVTAFQAGRQTVALVVNEFGETIGLVTLNDVMAALVGDIATEEEDGERDIVARDERSWIVDGTVAPDRFREVLGIDERMPGEADGRYRTVAGFAMTRLDRVPRIGDRFAWGDYTFEVMDMDGNRVDTMLVTRGERASTSVHR